MNGKMDNDTQMVWAGASLAFLTAMWSGMGTLGTLPAVGMLGVSAYTIGKYVIRDKMSIFLNHSKLATEDYKPTYRKRNTSYGYIYRMRMAPGQDTDDYEGKRLALEQYLNCGVELEYKDGYLWIKCYTGQLGGMYHYEYVKQKDLTVVVGRTRDGKMKINLAKLPHLLVGGETGGGKSVLLRNIVTSLVLRGNCTLHLVDRAMVEMGLFEDCKTVEDYCVTDGEIMEMLEKLTTLSKQRLTKLRAERRTHIRNERRHVVIFDEFADITDKGIKQLLMRRIAQDRKVGIHYILCTQYPKKEVVSTLIKTNMPGRIATKCTSTSASMVILDQPGAESLSTAGRMICKMDGQIKEFQGYFLTEDGSDPKHPDAPAAIDIVKHTFVRKPPKQTAPDTSGVISC